MLCYARGSRNDNITPDEVRAALKGVFDSLGERKRVLAIPPDYTRLNSYAGPITEMAYDYYGDRLTDEQVHAWLDDYAAFSAAMQKVKTFGEARPIRQWREDALKKCRSLAGWIMRRLLTEMDPADCDYRPELLRVIHGDYHYGNFLFVDGKVDAYLDLEEFRLGYPADDILRNIVCATEHLRWYAWGRRRRMLQVFALAVRRLPYSRHEWMMAVNARFISKLYMRTRKVRRFTLAQALNLAWRAGFYRRMRGIVADKFDIIAAQ